MRNFLMAGSAAAVVGLAASSAFAFPPNSPYAIWIPQGVDQTLIPDGTFADGGSGYDARRARHRYGDRYGTMTEGRSAFIYGDPETRVDPFGWQVESPEDSTFYSRGR